MNDLFHKSRRCAQSIIGTALFVTSIFLVTSGFLISAPVHAVEVERVVSPGGIEAWLVRDQSIPITSLAFSFQDAGGAEDPHGKSGLANLTASLLGEGAGDLDSQAFQGQLENLAIRLSFSAGLETFRGNLKTLNRNRDEAVNLLRLALSKARFDEDAVQRIRSQIEIGLKQRQTDPNSRAGRIWRKAMFADHPNGRPVNGTLTTLGAITTDDMRNFVASRLTRDRLIIGAVGDISAADLAALLDKAFGALPAAAAQRPQTPAAKLHETGDVFVSDMDIPQSVVVFGQPGLRRKDPDYYTAYVMNYILGGGGFASRLYNEVREKRGLVYSVYSYLNPMRKGPLISGGLATRNEQVVEALSLVRAEWTKMRESGVSADELRRAKQFLNGAFPLRLSSTSAIARILVSMQNNDLGIDYLDRRAGFINKVTRGDIDRVAKRLLNPKTLTVVVVGRPGNLEATAKTPDIDG